MVFFRIITKILALYARTLGLSKGSKNTVSSTEKEIG